MPPEVASVATPERTPLRREVMGRAAPAEVAGRSWEAALGRLAAGYRAAMADGASAETRRVA